MALATALGTSQFSRIILFKLTLTSGKGTSKPVQEALKITLVEAGDLSKIPAWSQPDGFSNRVSSITNASKGFLEGTQLAI